MQLREWFASITVVMRSDCHVFGDSRVLMAAAHDVLVLVKWSTFQSSLEVYYYSKALALSPSSPLPFSPARCGRVGTAGLLLSPFPWW